jgi:hypothetical protein
MASTQATHLALCSAWDEEEPLLLEAVLTPLQLLLLPHPEQ